MAHKEAQVALLNVMQKEVTRIVLFEEWDSEFHIFVKQMRAQNRGRPDVRHQLARAAARTPARAALRPAGRE